MEAPERDDRVLELLRRKDQMAAERTAINAQLAALAEEQASLDAELHELLGINPQPAQARIMTCSNCGEKGHNARRCPNGSGQ